MVPRPACLLLFSPFPQVQPSGSLSSFFVTSTFHITFVRLRGHRSKALLLVLLFFSFLLPLRSIPCSSPLGLFIPLSHCLSHILLPFSFYILSTPGQQISEQHSRHHPCPPHIAQFGSTTFRSTAPVTTVQVPEQNPTARPDLLCSFRSLHDANCRRTTSGPGPRLSQPVTRPGSWSRTRHRTGRRAFRWLPRRLYTPAGSRWPPATSRLPPAPASRASETGLPRQWHEFLLRGQQQLLLVLRHMLLEPQQRQQQVVLSVGRHLLRQLLLRQRPDMQQRTMLYSCVSGCAR